MNIFDYLNWGTNLLVNYLYSFIQWCLQHYYIAGGVIIVGLVALKLFMERKEDS